MSKLIIASNRLPFYMKKEGSDYVLEKSVSGLVTGLEDLRNSVEDSIWIGWLGIEESVVNENQKLIDSIKENGFIDIPLSTDLIDLAYNGFVNSELWAIHHGFINYSRFIEEEWQAFIKLNELFAKSIIENYEDGDIVYIQDFQLMLVPKMLKEHNSRIKVGFFLHIPFPSSSIFKLIPTYKELVESLSVSDYIGFHTQIFANSYKELCIENNLKIDNIDVNPIGVNLNKLTVEEDKVLEIRKQIKTPIILGCERADFAKGIVERLKAYRLLFEIYPETKENVTLVQIAVGSRKGSESYQQIGTEISELVADINGQYSTLNWTPIKFLTNGLSKQDLFNLYSASDICSINSLADGLNLTALEYVLVESEIKRDLILTEFAGASSILTKAKIVNPRNTKQIADCFYDSLIHNTDNVSDLKLIASKLTTDKWFNNFLTKINGDN